MESIGVASGRGEQEVGVVSVWNLWIWLQCIGVASQCCYKEVYIDILIIIINFPYSTCIRSFFGSSILTSMFIFKCFFSLVRIRIRIRNRNGDFLLRAART